MLRSPPTRGGYMAVTSDPLLRSPPMRGGYMAVTSDPLLRSPPMRGGYMAVTSEPSLRSCGEGGRLGLLDDIDRDTPTRVHLDEVVCQVRLGVGIGVAVWLR